MKAIKLIVNEIATVKTKEGKSFKTYKTNLPKLDKKHLVQLKFKMSVSLADVVENCTLYVKPECVNVAKESWIGKDGKEYSKSVVWISEIAKVVEPSKEIQEQAQKLADFVEIYEYDDDDLPF